AVGERTRAVVVVAPNNPTGSFLRSADWQALRLKCATRGVPIICDEVFLDYPLDPAADAVRGVLSTVHTADDGALIIVLGGLSKRVVLPQCNLGWLVVQGPHDLTGPARDKLELICDSYLSVTTAVQIAAGRLLFLGAEVRSAIAARIRHNLDALCQ